MSVGAQPFCEECDDPDLDNYPEEYYNPDDPTPPQDEDVVAPMKRSVAGKGLVHHFAEEEEDEDSYFEIGEHPDLHYYFQQYPRVSDDDVIKMCRSYASYLASLKGPPQKKAKK